MCLPVRRRPRYGSGTQLLADYSLLVARIRHLLEGAFGHRKDSCPKRPGSPSGKPGLQLHLSPGASQVKSWKGAALILSPSLLGH